jgi:hypothetical protein
MGDIDDINEATATATGDVAVVPSLKIRVAVSALRSVSYVLAVLWGMWYFTSGIGEDFWGIYDDPGFTSFPLICKVLSLCLLLWIVGGALLADMWKDGKGGFFFSLGLTSFSCASFIITLPFNRFIIFVSWAAPLIYCLTTRLLWLRFHDTGNATARIPRVALLYRQYFGIDGEYFAMKSAATQSPSVLLQAYAKLLAIGSVVADDVTEQRYWRFFGVLLLNCIVPPLLLSSERPWLRQQGAMLFDVTCDLFYLLGFFEFMLLHQTNILALLPTDVGSFFSNLFPLLRIRSIGRLLMTPRRRAGHHQENSQANGIDDGKARPPLPSRLTPKVASFFASLSLLMLAIVVWEQTVYPWDTNPCRPCECSAGRVLKICKHGGTRLFLAGRGITRVLPGAFVDSDLPLIREINLARNAITVVESGTFVSLPALKVLRLDTNRANTTSWFLETFFPTLRAYVPTDAGLASIERNAFAKNAQLEMLALEFNSFASIDFLSGALSEVPDLQELWLNGNPLTCEDVVPSFDGACF